MEAVSEILAAMNFAIDLSKEVEEWLNRVKSNLRYLFEIELRNMPGDLEYVSSFVSRMLKEIGCGDEGDCVFRGTQFRVAAFIHSEKFVEEVMRVLEGKELPDEEDYPDVIDVLLMVGVQKAKPDVVYELMKRIADEVQHVGATPVVQISVFGGERALKRLQRRLGDVKSKMLKDRLVLFLPTTFQWGDRDLYRRLFGGLFPFN